MDKLNINVILERTHEEQLLKSKLIEFEQNKNNIQLSRGFYVYGIPGIGKTEFVKRVLEDLGYSIIYYDTSHVRNKAIINNISKSNVSDRNVLSMFHKKVKPIAIIMDEIDGMNSGDKGGITALIKLIRSKKTKKQKLENSTNIPIICIGNNHSDKKINELMKVCTLIHLNKPSTCHVDTLIQHMMPSIDHIMKTNIIEYIDGDLRKLMNTYSIYQEQQHLLKQKLLSSVFQAKMDNEDTKTITKHLINNRVDFDDHNVLISETDRTSISLLFHENIIDSIVKNSTPKTRMEGLKTYLKILENINYSDYIDRITFQKQIWIYNELSSYMKNIYNNNIYHDEYYNGKPFTKDIRFTKVLTKYSTEYNNGVFIELLCEKLNMDKNDLLSFFVTIRNNDSLEQYYEHFESLEITKLDIQRIYRFIDNYTLEDDDSLSVCSSTV